MRTRINSLHRPSLLVAAICLAAVVSVALFSIVKKGSESDAGAGRLSEQPFESGLLRIHVKKSSMARIQKKRDGALQTGVLIASSDDYVPAVISYDGKFVMGSIRLKGDWADHLNTHKWSFRIKLKKGNVFSGMRRFSIHHPKTRNWLNEWVFHRILREEGIVGLRYRFIEVVFNGKYLGVYALEEHFDKLLLEHNERRAGPIIKMKEDGIWRHRSRFPLITEHTNDYYYSSPIDSFREENHLKDRVEGRQLMAGITLLESFREGRLKASEVFDADKLGTFLAVCDLAGAGHALIFHNMRFYFNPFISRLEPIGFDADAGKISEFLAYECHSDDGKDKKSVFLSQLFRDELLVTKYKEALERLSGRAYLDDVFKNSNAELTRELRVLRREFPMYDFSTDVYYQNQDLIRSYLAGDND